MIWLIITTYILTLYHCKSIHEIDSIVTLARSNGFMYLTRMNFGVGNSTVTIDIKIRGQYHALERDPSYWIGLITDLQFDRFQAQTQCEKKAAILTQHHRIGFQQGKASIHLNISQQSSRTWYYYLYTCEDLQGQRQNLGLRYYLDIVSLNDGSHFGQDQKMVYVYVVAFCLSIFLVPRNVAKLVKDLREQDYDYGHIAITIGIVTLAIGYVCKLSHLFSYSQDGYGIPLLDVGYLIFRSISESTVVVLLVIIAWGWTITFIRNGSQQFFVPLGVLGGLIQIINTALGKVFDDSEFKNHHFDCVTGIIILAFKCLIVLLFTIGAIKTHRQAKPKVKKFVKQFAIMGFIYISVSPVSVIVCELLVPTNLQNYYITAITELTHALANSLLTFMITSSKSMYSRLEYNSRSVFASPEGAKLF